MSHQTQTTLGECICDELEKRWPGKFDIPEVDRWANAFADVSWFKLCEAIAEWRSGEKGHFPPKIPEIKKIMGITDTAPEPPKRYSWSEDPRRQEEIAKMEQARRTQETADAFCATLSDEQYARAVAEVVDERYPGAVGKRLKARGRKASCLLNVDVWWHLTQQGRESVATGD